MIEAKVILYTDRHLRVSYAFDPETRMLEIQEQDTASGLFITNMILKAPHSVQLLADLRKLAAVTGTQGA